MTKTIFALLLLGCSGLLSACEGSHSGPYERRSDPSMPARPLNRQYGPWDMPATGTAPGPPTWYGCPQQSRACYPE